jgi:hypothetical protein
MRRQPDRAKRDRVLSEVLANMEMHMEVRKMVDTNKVEDGTAREYSDGGAKQKREEVFARFGIETGHDVVKIVPQSIGAQIKHREILFCDRDGMGWERGSGTRAQDESSGFSYFLGYFPVVQDDRLLSLPAVWETSPNVYERNGETFTGLTVERIWICNDLTAKGQPKLGGYTKMHAWLRELAVAFAAVRRAELAELDDEQYARELTDFDGLFES